MAVLGPAGCSDMGLKPAPKEIPLSSNKLPERFRGLACIACWQKDIKYWDEMCAKCYIAKYDAEKFQRIERQEGDMR